eukprot:scaffold8887_cov56-Attheya_sp.AAC.2
MGFTSLNGIRPKIHSDKNVVTSYELKYYADVEYWIVLWYVLLRNVGVIRIYVIGELVKGIGW